MKRSLLLRIALFWLALTLGLAIVLVVGAYIGSPTRTGLDGLREGVVGPILIGWVYYGWVPGVPLLVAAFFIRAYRLRRRSD